MAERTKRLAKGERCEQVECDNSGWKSVMRLKSWRFLAVAILLLQTGTALARGPWRASESNTRGWQLMSPEEHIKHQARIRSFSTLADCESYRTEHHREMQARAAQQGTALAGGGRDFCQHLRSAPPADGERQ